MTLDIDVRCPGGNGRCDLLWRLVRTHDAKGSLAYDLVFLAEPSRTRANYL